MRLKKTAPFFNQNGALLIGLIMTLVIISTLSGALVYLTTGSTYEEVLANLHSRVYYVAEAGGRYASYLIQNDPDKYNVETFPSETIGPFAFSNDDFFTLEIDNMDAENLKVQSTGTINSGTWSETNRLITFKIRKRNPLSGGDDGATNVSFDGDDDMALDETWNISSGTDADMVSSGPSGGESALQFKGDTGFISLRWQDNDDVDLSDARSSSDELLSYEIQVKVHVEHEGEKGDHYMFGLSFRVDTDNDRCYGISFFRSYPGDDNQTPDWIKSSTTPFNTDAPDIQGIRDGDVYAVFWLKENGSYTLKDYKKLTSSEGVIDGDGELKAWSTLLVKVEETKEEGSRTNHITAYVQEDDDYPRDDDPLQWSDSGTFNPIDWQNDDEGYLDDSTLTTENFDSVTPDEIGVHAFYDSNAANDQLFDDFGLQVDGLGGADGMTQY